MVAQYFKRKREIVEIIVVSGIVKFWLLDHYFAFFTIFTYYDNQELRATLETGALIIWLPVFATIWTTSKDWPTIKIIEKIT